MRAARVWLLIILLFLGLAPGALAAAPATIAAAPEIREKLEYQISLGPWSDVARVHLVLKELKPGHYLAEFSGAAQGMWKLLSRWLPERYQTEMLYRDGRLQPMVYREEFEDDGYEVISALNGESGLEKFKQEKPDLVILDIQMPGMNGVEVLRQMKMIDAAVPVILSSAYQEFKRDLGTWASDEYVVKSGNLEELKKTVRRLLKED